MTFTAPAANGSPITSYTVTSSPGGVVENVASSPVTMVGLTNGTSYRFTVTATNAIGMGGVSSVSNAVTPVHVGGIEVTLFNATPGTSSSGVTTGRRA